ncbi:uncharacterized protein AB9W97_007367 isoform 4-T5 [Spinachia spinachia]
MPVKHFESVDNLGLQSRPRRHYRDESTPREENRQRDWRFWRFLQTGEASRWLSSLYNCHLGAARNKDRLVLTVTGAVPLEQLEGKLIP